MRLVTLLVDDSAVMQLITTAGYLLKLDITRKMQNQMSGAIDMLPVGLVRSWALQSFFGSGLISGSKGGARSRRGLAALLGVRSPDSRSRGAVFTLERRGQGDNGNSGARTTHCHDARRTNRTYSTYPYLENAI
jgi:hypothetical protein